MGRICRVVPKQWTHYEPIGEIIPNTRFVVFKTPINDVLASKIPKEKRFNVSNLLRIMAERGLTLGLVIDLTDTDRYYDHADIEGMCIDYEKINSPGRGFVERDDLVKTFNDIVENFLNSNPDNDAVIGVHCTNGVNRSGYLVCRFLIDRLGWSSHDAIDAFERGRGYPIERGAYVQALHRAAKERRLKKRHKHADEVVVSSEESEIQRHQQFSLSRKRSKHKKKHKIGNATEPIISGDDENGGGTPDMEAVWSQMAAVLEQHESLILNDNQAAAAAANYANDLAMMGDGMQRSQSSSHLSLDGSPFVGSTGTAEQMEEDDDDGDFSGEQENATSGAAVEEVEVSKSQKRRARRQRLQKEFELMKTGNFWKINEMQKEKYKGK
ncbi:unnamed protein product [Anisakis simplex]|uniref:Probable tyrosine-protein phosphatase (inferred by orthology to a C. elegans protein) n=1 Tax=Anisakis simplex TaxID=6269 RepID=A0A0M3JX69_ANISI|nr:unnamed protein product [Anisakis simplex]